jgi:hypothetical protein
MLRTPVRAPKANAICERFLGSVRRECLYHVLILDVAAVFQAVHCYEKPVPVTHPQ